MGKGVKGVRLQCCFFFLLVNVCMAQTANNTIKTFDDLISYLNARTQYTFSYPNNLGKVTITIPENADPGNVKDLEKILTSAGITMVVRGTHLIFKKSSAGKPKVVAGYVRDSDSSESLVGANVYDPANGKGSSTNAFGFFSLVTDADSIVISYIGYRQQVFHLGDVRTDLEIALSKDDMVLSEVVISDYHASHELSEMSTMKLSPELINKLPVFMGESDIMKTIQLIPGVQAGTEGSAGIYVRGGSSDQNLILLDSVPVYNANHLFGFFSIFNTDAIRNVELIKGGFPARYGGRLSSIIDIQMKEGNMNQTEGEGAIGVVSSKFTLSGPIAKGKTAFMISGRRTYIDALAVPIQKASDSRRIVGANFWDLNAKINHVISSRDRIYLSFYAGKNNLYDRHHYNNGIDIDEREDAKIKWGNITSALRWNHVFSDRLFGNVTVTYSRYQFDLGT